MVQANALVSQNLNDEYRLMALMALFEDEFSIDWILEISGCKATDVLGIVDELDITGIVEKKRPGIYRFNDRRMRNELMSSIPEEEKENWHLLISRILFRDIPDRNDAVLAAVGHLLHLTNDEKSCRHILEAGDIYRKTYHYQKALACYMKVIHDLDEAESDHAYRLFIKSAIGYTKLFMADPEMGTFVKLMERAISKAKKKNQTADVALLMMNLALMEWSYTDIGKAIRRFHEGWHLAQTIDDPRLNDSAFLFNSFFLFIQGRIREVVQNYEKVHSDIDKYPTHRFPLMAANTIASCYAYNGQIQRGIAMLEALYDQHRSTGDSYSSCYTGLMIGSIYIEIGRLDEAIQHLEFTLEKAIQASSNFHINLMHLKLAYAQYRKKDIKKSLKHLNTALKFRRKNNITNKYNSYHGSELFWAMELGDYPVVKDLGVYQEINRDLESKNILIKGIAYRYQSLMEERKGASQEKVLNLLLESEKLLDESGHELQLARTRMELARIFLCFGEKRKAKQVIHKSSDILTTFMHRQIPDNLLFLIKDLRTDKNLLEEIMRLGNDLSAITNLRDLLRHILTAVNQITGAERGAVFLLDENKNIADVVLRAARNLTTEDILKPDFSSSMKMIKTSVITGEAQISLTSPPAKIDLRKKKDIHSRICVPMKIRKKIIGVLYVDNRIFPSAFKKTDIKILKFFSGAAAIALENTQMREENEALKQKLEARYEGPDVNKKDQKAVVEFVGDHEVVRKLLKDTQKVAKTDATVLISGETGVGKELIASAIHYGSKRRNKAFVRVNCSAFPETLIASELFGHEKGAYTGANERRIGRFEMANGGTLFLDEIGDISPEVQVRLLRVLQSKEFERIGGRKTISSDFRLVAATNRDLQDEVRKGKFREDLFYRLNVLSIKIPPLRERKEDIPLLIDYFLKQYAQKHGKPVSKISEKDIENLANYDWPGNVRELRNIIERGAILSTASDFNIPEFRRNQTTCSECGEPVTLAENEKRHIMWALKKTGGKIRGPGGAAQLLDINHNTLYSRMKKLGVRRSDA